MKKRRWSKAEIEEYRKIHGAFFYCNQEDANFFVPKPYGIGWTINWANPMTWFLVMLIAVFYIGRFIHVTQTKQKDEENEIV